jgi:hypothetical protein
LSLKEEIVKRNSNSRWYVSGLGVLLAISMSMLLLVGCSSDNPVIPGSDDPPVNPPDDGYTGNVDDADLDGDPELNPPPGFDKGDNVPVDQRDAEEVYN